MLIVSERIILMNMNSYNITSEFLAGTIMNVYMIFHLEYKENINYDILCIKLGQ